MTDEGDVPLNRDANPEQEAQFFESHEDRGKRLLNENLAQDILERGKYAKRSFRLTKVWVWFIISSTIAQFILNAINRGLDRYQFIALITTTSGSVLTFWLVVGRYLFHSSISNEIQTPRPQSRDSRPPARG